MYGLNWEGDVADATDSEAKFKVGDLVRVVKRGGEIGGSHHGSEVGDETTISRIHGNDWFMGDNGWGYFAHEIELAAPDCAERKVERDNVETLTIKLDVDTSAFTKKIDEALGFNRPCIVARVNQFGTPLPSSLPHVHANAEVATQEAERLARNNPGQEFAVYQRVVGRKCEVGYEMKEVA